MFRPNMVVSTWTDADATVSTGPAMFGGIIAMGSAAAGTITVLDGAVIKFVVPVAITASGGFVLPIAADFSTSLVIDNTGTAGYSVIYRVI